MTLNASTSQDASRWSAYSGSLRAILDEYARAIRDLETVMLAVPVDRYTARTALSDKEFGNISDIARHVIGAAHSYAHHIDHALDKKEGPPPRTESAHDSPWVAVTSLWEAFDHMVEVLGRIKAWTDEEQEAVRFTSRWGQPFDIEQMLEHAIVHILRHRRQLERWANAPLA